MFLFLIIGNINLRVNTIFFLLENGISDGVLSLQRTVFELQLAFEVYSDADADEKNRYIELYLNKKGFESTMKWDRFLSAFQDNDQFDTFTELDRKLVSILKENYKKKIEVDSKKSVYKLWFELASDRTVKELSDKYFTEVIYYSNYDELSNWVHPQRLEENLNPVNFNQNLPKEYLNVLIGTLMWDIGCLSEDIAFMAGYLKLAESQRFFMYGEKMADLQKQLKNLALKEK